MLNTINNTINKTFFNLSYLNQNRVLNFEDICPTQFELYMSWYNAYVILFGLTLFCILFTFIVMDIQLTKLKKQNKELLNGFIRE